MENFYKISFQMMTAFGLTIERDKETWKLFIVRLSSIIVLSLTVVQEMAFTLGNNPLIDKIILFPCMICVMEGYVKVLTIIRFKDKLKDMIDYLDNLYTNMDKKDQVEFANYASRFRTFSTLFGIMSLTTVHLFTLFPVVVISASYFMNGTFSYIYPFFFWWPFDSIKYYVPAYIYQIVSCVKFPAITLI